MEEGPHPFQRFFVEACQSKGNTHAKHRWLIPRDGPKKKGNYLKLLNTSVGCACLCVFFFDAEGTLGWILFIFISSRLMWPLESRQNQRKQISLLTSSSFISNLVEKQLLSVIGGISFVVGQSCLNLSTTLSHPLIGAFMYICSLHWGTIY